VGWEIYGYLGIHSRSFFDKKHENLSFEELCKAPASAISGISESDAANLKKAFGVDIIQELAENKYLIATMFVTVLAALARILGGPL